MHPHTGVARLALSSDAPVVPMVHWGTQDVLDGYRKRYRPLPRTTVTVRCAAPVDLSAFRDRAIDAALLREVSDLIAVRVRDLLAEVRAEPAPTGFYRWSRT
jgi:1-acyl-sn-glycerol-3-phosphate acyltransferase